MNTITPELIAKCREYTSRDKNVRTLNAAMGKTDLKDLAYIKMNGAKLDGPYEIEIKTRGITAQRQSGRCWMFAFMNVLRECVAEKCNMDAPFELSGNHLAFYDKLEKANNILEMAIATADRPLTDRILGYILAGYGDGGHWSMCVDVAKKYGVVPKSVMPELHHSENTGSFMRLLMSLVRKDIAELREMIARGEDPLPRKEEMLAEIYKAQCIAFGEPVQVFDFEYTDKDGKIHVDRDLTPHTFLDKYVGYAFDEYVNVANYPVSFLKEDTPFTFHHSGNMIDKNMWKLNISQEAMEELCLKQLRAGEVVYFGCDSGAFGGRFDGIWDPDCFIYEDLLGGVECFMDDRGKRLEYHESITTHNMVLCGVNFDRDGKPNRWKIENSWGAECGKNGYFVCSEKYFKNYVYEMVINKKYFSEEQLQMLEKEPVQLTPWDGDSL